jgi:hypothetical protein
MRRVAVRVDLLDPVAGCVDAPGKDALARVGAGRELERLDAVAHWLVVAIQGFVTDLELHDQSVPL